MASNIFRRGLATAAAPSTVKIGLIPADGIGREGKYINTHFQSFMLLIYSNYKSMQKSKLTFFFIVAV